MTKKQGYILDHWGKGSPSAAETAVLDQEVEVLKQEMEEASQKKIPSTVDTNSLISKVFYLSHISYPSFIIVLNKNTKLGLTPCIFH